MVGWFKKNTCRRRSGKLLHQSLCRLLDSPSETVQNFINAYKAEYDKVPNSFAALGYDAVYAMVEAITAAGLTESADTSQL